MTIETLVVGQMATNCYIVDNIIIDPGDDAEYIISHLKTKPILIVATHGHFDHIMAARALQLAYAIPFVMHQGDVFLVTSMRSSAKHFLGLSTVDPPPAVNKMIRDKDKIAGFTVIHTPGHTPGGVCLYSPKNNVIFTGDTIFADGAVGRTDHIYSDKTALSRSIQTIVSLPPKTILLSGHGGKSSIERERRYHRVIQ
jgi:hydroxyacylglutathione hydrolase